MANASVSGSIGRGLAAGAVGTAVMTGLQLAVRKTRGEPLRTRVPRTWAEAPAPAQVVKKAAEAVGHGRDVTKKDVPRITNLMHWGYGLWWGTAYGVAARSRGSNPAAGGAVLALGVWTAEYAELVPLGISKKPWDVPPRELALDLAYHLSYGLAVAGAYAALDR
ncbi:MAG: hypothetical protein QOK22_1305 [Gaiellaceae bacterium]|nr:hypothetical protein [Gaiellaceae bacterium]